jgi:alkane 1-monooxygenase
MPISLLIPFVALAAIPAAAIGGAVMVSSVAPALLVIFAGLDGTLGVERDEPRRRDRPLLYRTPLWLFVALQLGLTLWAAGAAGDSPGLGALLALALASGTMAGVFGMLVAHELIHSHHRFERALGLSLLMTVGYMHFRIAHIYGHHRLAATPADPATARLGESAYRFLPRAIAGQWRDAWRHERRRTAGRRWPMLANRMHRYLALEAAFFSTVPAALGGRAGLFVVVEAAVAIVILELFNYVAHYGLVRRLRPDGSVEPLGPQHSWNVRQRFNNWALFNGGHHSDHHRAPRRPYQSLRPIADAPMLPTGYAGSLCLVLLPPLWRRAIDARIAQRCALTPSPAPATQSRLPRTQRQPAADRAA